MIDLIECLLQELQGVVTNFISELSIGLLLS